jgi:hypothetical protein
VQAANKKGRRHAAWDHCDAQGPTHGPSESAAPPISRPHGFPVLPPRDEGEIFNALALAKIVAFREGTANDGMPAKRLS